MEGSDAQMPQVEMVEEIPGSPTEIAEESDLETELGTRPKLEKENGILVLFLSLDLMKMRRIMKALVRERLGRLGASQPPISGTSSRDMSVR